MHLIGSDSLNQNMFMIKESMLRGKGSGCSREYLSLNVCWIFFNGCVNSSPLFWVVSNSVLNKHTHVSKTNRLIIIVIWLVYGCWRDNNTFTEAGFTYDFLQYCNKYQWNYLYSVVVFSNIQREIFLRIFRNRLFKKTGYKMADAFDMCSPWEPTLDPALNITCIFIASGCVLSLTHSLRSLRRSWYHTAKCIYWAKRGLQQSLKL